VLKNPPILILDEATSAVDNETEAAIQRSLEKITVDRTTIAIAHRLSTVRNADCIYVMEQGQLVEQGRHEELIERQRIYASLWRVQSGIK
jgi:ATP-binding cassette subfamily B protein